MTRDIKIYETGNGGDIFIAGNDLETVDGFENMPYLAMFGGNVEMTTQQVGDNDEQRFDWWGNSFIPESAAQMNSLTEKKLITTPVTSQGRILIEQVIRADFKFMEEFANITASVAVLSDDWIGITVQIREPGVLQQKKFQYIWDATRGVLRGTDANDYVPPVEPPTPETYYRILEDGGYRLLMDGSRRIYTPS